MRKTLTRLRILRTRSFCSSSVIWDAARFRPPAVCCISDPSPARGEKRSGVKNRGLRPTSASAMRSREEEDAVARRDRCARAPARPTARSPTRIDARARELASARARLSGALASTGNAPSRGVFPRAETDLDARGGPLRPCVRAERVRDDPLSRLRTPDGMRPMFRAAARRNGRARRIDRSLHRRGNSGTTVFPRGATSKPTAFGNDSQNSQRVSSGRIDGSRLVNFIPRPRPDPHHQPRRLGNPKSDGSLHDRDSWSVGDRNPSMKTRVSR